MQRLTNRKQFLTRLTATKPSKSIKPTNRGPLYTTALREMLSKNQPLKNNHGQQAHP